MGVSMHAEETKQDMVFGLRPQRALHKILKN